MQDARNKKKELCDFASLRENVTRIKTDDADLHRFFCDIAFRPETSGLRKTLCSLRFKKNKPLRY